MTEKIVTKIYNAGDPKESTWPPLYGTGGAGRYWYDKETGKMTQEPPKRDVPHGQAPYIIMDTIEPYRHPAAEKWVDSRKALNDLDKACGTITTDKKIAPDPTWQRDQRKARHKDIVESRKKAVEQLDSVGPGHLLTEEQRANCDRVSEIVSEALGWDAFNVTGKVNNEKGKKYRRGGRGSN